MLGGVGEGMDFSISPASSLTWKSLVCSNGSESTSTEAVLKNTDCTKDTTGPRVPSPIELMATELVGIKIWKWIQSIW
jgi:hypothetical protein